MDINSLTNVTSSAVKAQEELRQTSLGNANESGSLFSNLLDSAMDSINTTNGYLSDAENEEIKLALGETENVHDLTIALSKASTALQYTVAIRDKFLDAYKELMQINV